MRRAYTLLFAVVVMGSVASLAVAVNEKTNEKLKLPEELTQEEMLKLYRKYNITENDIKFAKGELPYVMAGTILDGSKKVIITEDGELPERIKKKVEAIGYDLVISKRDAIEISNKAKYEYIKRYGVDPDNPKVIMYNGIPLPKEYIDELIRKGVIKPPKTSDTVASIKSEPGPNQINGKIYVEIFMAKDDAHKPEMSYTMLELMTGQALDRFEEEFGVKMYDTWYIGFWDASNVPDPHSSSQVLDDLREDCRWAQNADNEIVFGWADDLDLNGRAFSNGYYAVGSENPTHLFDWSEKSVVQHEISHNFNAPDHGYDGPRCIMTYLHAFLGFDQWCDDCKFTLTGNIWGLWE